MMNDKLLSRTKYTFLAHLLPPATARPLSLPHSIPTLSVRLKKMQACVAGSGSDPPNTHTFVEV